MFNNKWALVSVIGVAAGAVLLAFSRRYMDGQYFTIAELTHSDTAVKNGISNSPNASQLGNLRKLIKLLDKVRARLGRAIHVNSGFRSAELNKIVGGVPTSQHSSGQAADIVPVGGSIDDLFRACIQVGGYDQLIIETVGGSKWVHISISDNPRGQILSYNGSKYTNITKNYV